LSKIEHESVTTEGHAGTKETYADYRPTKTPRVAKKIDCGEEKFLSYGQSIRVAAENPNWSPRALGSPRVDVNADWSQIGGEPDKKSVKRGVQGHF